MSEDISSFSNMVVTLTANDGSTYNVGLQYLGKDSFDYSNGDVKYKFRIMTENITVQKHFEKVTLYSIYAKDTIGNTTTNTKIYLVIKELILRLRLLILEVHQMNLA